jgi:uncharacterized protein YjbI with pentapeptide repeats
MQTGKIRLSSDAVSRVMTILFRLKEFAAVHRSGLCLSAKAGFALTLFIAGAGWGLAFDKAKYDAFPTTNARKYCDLTGADLSGRDLRGANLSNANLAKAMSRAHLREADLSGADLSLADLSRANLQGANLSGANLAGATLDGARLDDAKFCRTVMPDGATNDSGC